jgi:ABC-type glycerol-3-phosphate transport system substrate-binding protein
VSVPADLSAISTAYDKQLFEDFGVDPLSSTPTIDDVVNRVPKLTGTNPRTGQMCYGMYYNAGVAVHQLLYFLGRGAITFGSIDPRNPSALQMDTPEIKAAIQEIIRLAQYCPPGFVLGHGAENWGTTNNTIGIALSITPQGGGSAGMLTALQNKLTDRFVVTGGIRTNGHTFYVSAGEYAIASKTRDKDAAWEALKFLSGSVAQKFLFDNFFSLPSWKDQSWLTPESDPYGPPFLAEAAAAQEAFFPEFMFETYRPWLNATISNAIAGQSVDLDAGLAQMQQQANQWVVANYTVQNGQVVPK